LPFESPNDGQVTWWATKGERFVLMVTGALAVWNVGIAFVVVWRPTVSTRRVSFESREGGGALTIILR